MAVTLNSMRKSSLSNRSWIHTVSLVQHQTDRDYITIKLLTKVLTIVTCAQTWLESLIATKDAIIHGNKMG